ncbi:MAG: hypothetical protein KDD25_06380 [Bdellovibrionales bacterium]|nr:hypothetical protein [Bdellovibrionales bacterium]
MKANKRKRVKTAKGRRKLALWAIVVSGFPLSFAFLSLGLLFIDPAFQVLGVFFMVITPAAFLNLHPVKKRSSSRSHLINFDNVIELPVGKNQPESIHTFPIEIEKRSA